MAKDRPTPHLHALTTWLTSGEGTPPAELAADAERARTALAARDAGALSRLVLPVQAAAVEALLQARDGATLVALGEASGQKEITKAVGRALHVLKTKGVKVDEEARGKGEGFRYHTVDGEQPRSYASITDPEGDRMVWLGVTHATEGRMAFQAVVNETTGLGLFQIFPRMTAKVRRLILNELEEKKIPVYEVDADYARWLVEEGRRRNEATGTEVPKEYFQAEPYIGTFQDLHADPHPVYGLLMDRGLSGEPTADEVARGATLHEIDEVSGWVPQGDILDEAEKQASEATGGAMLTAEAERREKLTPVFEALARTYFTDEVRARWHRRLLDLSQHLLSRNQPEKARLAMAVGEQLGDASADAGQNPFAVELFHKWYKAKAEATPAAAEGDAPAAEEAPAAP